MPTKRRKNAPTDLVPDEVIKGLKDEKTPTDVALVSSPRELISLVEAGQISVIPTNRLAPLYIVLDAMKKRVDKLLERIKDKDEVRNGMQSRRDEGEATGDKGQHREFTFPGVGTLTVQERRSWIPNPEKLEKLLKEKKLWEQATDLVISTAGTGFQKFLRQHRKEIAAFGVEVAEQLNMEKVDGLCKAKLISTEELEEILDKPDPTYALIAKYQPER